jgi:hypothetical protein
MVSSRTATAVVGLVASLAVSVLLWYYFNTVLFFLVVPFVPFRFRNGEQPPVKECPVCDFRTRSEEYDYCPRDGHKLD